jgi:hypothetical protein
MQMVVCGLQECKYVVLANRRNRQLRLRGLLLAISRRKRNGVGSKEVRTKKLIIVEQNCDLSLFSSKIVINRLTRT